MTSVVQVSLLTPTEIRADFIITLFIPKRFSVQ